MKSRWVAVTALLFSGWAMSLNSAKAVQQAAPQESANQTSGAAEQIKQISTSELKDLITKHQKFTLIDVRSDVEWKDGHAANAIHIPRLAIPDKIGSVVPDKSARVVLYCLGGVRSAAAAGTMQKMGYTNVFSLTGGFRNYQADGLPVQK